MDTEDDLVQQLQDKLNQSDSAQHESDGNSQIGEFGLQKCSRKREPKSCGCGMCRLSQYFKSLLLCECLPQ